MTQPFDPFEPGPFEPASVEPAASHVAARPAARRSGRVLASLIVAAAVALVGFGMGAWAANQPSGAERVLVAGANPSAEPAANAGEKVKKPKPEKHGRITISAISGSTLSLTGEDGWTGSVTIGADVTLMRAGVAVGVGSLAVGDEVKLKQTRNADGTFTVTGVRVVLPHVGGTITAIGASSLTIELKDGTSKVVALTGDTVYRRLRADITKGDLAVGDRIGAEGTVDSGGAFTALVVKVKVPHVKGELTAKTATSLTLTKKDGTTVTVALTSDTAYVIPGDTTPTLAELAVGMRIDAAGTLDASGTLHALEVKARPPKGTPHAEDAPSATPGS